MKIKKACAVCEKMFTAKSNKALYCSVACRMISYRTRNELYLTQNNQYKNLLEMKDEFILLSNLQKATLEDNQELRKKYNQLVLDYNKLVKEYEKVKIGNA